MLLSYPLITLILDTKPIRRKYISTLLKINRRISDQSLKWMGLRVENPFVQVDEIRIAEDQIEISIAKSLAAVADIDKAGEERERLTLTSKSRPSKNSP